MITADNGVSRHTWTAITDAMGNPLADKTNVAGVIVDPTSATFPGNPPAPGDFVNTDDPGDSLELAGAWTTVLSVRDSVEGARRTISRAQWQFSDDGKSVRMAAGFEPGKHKVKIELVDAEGNVFTAQTVTFHSPGKEVGP